MALKVPTQSRTYHAWEHMLQRCRNPKDPAYERYGGEGITVCKRWLKFRNFIKDMGICPVGRSLDRFPDRTGNYTKENCRWATPQEQNSNRKGCMSVEQVQQMKELRAAGWPKKKIGRHMGVDAKTVTNWERKNWGAA